MCVISNHYITYRYNIICEVNRDGMILKNVSNEFKNDIYYDFIRGICLKTVK